MRSILVHVERGDAGASRVESALSLARLTGGHVTLLIDTPVMRYTTVDAMGGTAVATDALQEAIAADDGLAASLGEHLTREDVPFTILRGETEPLDALSTSARLADVVVIARADALAADLPLAVRCPVLALNDGETLTFPIERACIAWDGSAEAAAALRGAVPMLSGCSQVTVVSVEDTPKDWPALDAVEYLSRHGIRAEMQAIPRTGSVEQSLAHELQLRQCQLLVMGAFGHSRVREFIFGGVTKSFLEYAAAPALLLAH